MSTHTNMQAALMAGDRPSGDDRESAPPRIAVDDVSFDDLYDAHADSVFRALQRLGVPAANVDDALQDVFITAHRRFATFEGRSSRKTWLFGIAMRVVLGYRRAARRAGPTSDIDPDTLIGAGAGPLDDALQAERVRLLDQLLGELDEDRRAVFILCELEQMTTPDIAETLGINVNTAYSRLRLAREDFEQALARHRARARRQT